MYDILNKINKPQDLKALDKKELSELCSQIRDFLVEKVTKCGGHLASNLGVVELTVALHLIYDMPSDKIVWDVGHQSYVHKILTGRREQFDTLRQYNGLSGFPKTGESEFDVFNTGHSSTSVSAALGMARARDLKGESGSVAAVFGDGALTGGMIYEALNDVGHNKTPMVLILNDNEMSISKNVGALSKYLRLLRQTKSYHKSKASVDKLLNHVPLVGDGVKNLVVKLKNAVRLSVLPSTFFDDLGIEYLGPVDGHDLDGLINVLRLAKSMSEPVLVHVITKKGKGYKPAEMNPQIFHGISPKQRKSGENPKYPDYSQCAGETLINLAKRNDNFVAVTAAMPSGVGLVKFSKEYPKRFFDVGIAEQHAVTFAAGLAISGITPVFAVYSSFLQRSYDQILHDVCLQKLHCVFLIDRAGIVGSDGETHHGIFDISFLSDMPYMTVLAPSSFEELEEMIDYAINKHKGPIAIRYPRGRMSIKGTQKFELNKVRVINPDEKNVIVTFGRMVKTAGEAAKILNEENIGVKIIVASTLYPLDNKLCDYLSGAKCVITLEDHVKSGGFGSLVGSLLAENGIKTEFYNLAFPNVPVIHGNTDEIDAHYGLDAVSVAQKIKELINGR